MKRSRGRNRRPGGNQQNAFNNPNRHFESVGPDVKIRGSAQQVLEKYQQYARDAHTSGDRVLSEAYFQYAEHYQRIVAKQNEARTQQQGGQPQNRSGNGNGNGNGPRDDRDPRGSQDRDPRGGGNEESSQSYDDQGEAEVVAPVSAHRSGEDESDSLRVIDRDDDREDAAEASDGAPAENRGERAGGDKNRRARKPYRPREEGVVREDRPPRDDRVPREPRPPREPVVAVSETDGVMKTLARGRRKPAPEEGAPAETTD
ncbi:DUF4167 domain-containing protein [Hyphomonas sp.]|jgi:hypothetical protein|uniref:DUF4167 domain-containing protein n=1 Tax=Hyphomonas sp. TaxID=87 RepID=UPI0025B9E700|nr:DUF4167 domain-containing protein [Hyphomonas sp.]